MPHDTIDPKKAHLILFFLWLPAVALGLWLAPFSILFILVAIAWGLLFLILRFVLWKPETSWLPTLTFWLVAIVGRGCTIYWMFPLSIRTDSRANGGLSLLFVGIVGVVAFGLQSLYWSAKVKRPK